MISICLCEQEKSTSRASELLLQFEECERERVSYKTELRELKTRESRVMGDYAELEDENISLQKQLMQLKQAQVLYMVVQYI